MAKGSIFKTKKGKPEKKDDPAIVGGLTSITEQLTETNHILYLGLSAAKKEAADAAGLSPAEEKQKNEDDETDNKKRNSILNLMAGGISSLFEMSKKGLKAAKLGGMGLLSTLAIGGLLIALGKFLQSDSFKDMTKFIKEVILPKLAKFWDFLKENWVEIGIVITAVLAAFVIVKAVMVAAAIVKTITAIGVAFAAIKAFFAATLLPAFTAMMVPLLPIIAIAAAIGLAIYSLWEAFKDFQTTLEETGSITEALKAGAAKFMGVLLGFIPMLILKLTGWVAGLFGFDDFKEKLAAIDPIQAITDSYMKLFDDIEIWVKKLFDFGAVASGQLSDYVGEKLDKIINFAEEIYNKYIKPIVDWVKGIFGAGVDKVKNANSIMDMIPDLSSLMPDLPTWDNIKGKIGNLLNDLLQGMAKMLDIPLLGSVSKGVAGLGNKVASSLGVTSADRYDPKNNSMNTVDTASGKILSAAEITQYEDARVARSAAAGGTAGGDTNIVDASVKSSHTTTGPSGQSSLINTKFGRLLEATG